MMPFPYKWNKGIHLTIVGTVAFVAATLIFTQGFGAFPLPEELALDMLFTYDVSYFFHVRATLTDAQRHAYLMIHVFDYFFLLGFYPFLALVMTRLIDARLPFRHLVYIPLIAMVGDLVENLMMDIHIMAYPSEFGLLAHIATVASPLKFTMLYLTFAILLIFAVIKVVRRT